MTADHTTLALTDRTRSDLDALPAAHRTRLAGWLDLAARGWHLFPVRPGGKAPAIAGWQERATTDPDRLMRFFTAHPAHNAGIACGPSGLLVVDCDMPRPTTDPDSHGRAMAVGPRDGIAVLADLASSRGGLPAAWTVATPSGGQHLYFRAPARPRLGNTAKALGPMLDTRGHGGQVLAPGSRLPNGDYELLDDTDPTDLPGWLLWRLSANAPTTISGPRERPPTVAGDRTAYVSAVVRAELQRVTAAERGGHNAAVFTAARALGQLIGAGALDRTDAEHDLTHAAGHIVAGPCDCTARDIAASITSGLDHGTRRPRRLPTPRTVEGRRTA